MSRIILTDPHGCLRTLEALIAKLPPGVPLTFAGDLIDRGPNSKGVIELVKSGGYDCVLGNHEVMMIDELRFTDPDRATADWYNGIWMMNGGDVCLDSYEYNGKQDLETLKKHYEWLKTLPYYIEYPELKDANGNHLLVTHTTASEVWEETNHDSPQFHNAVTWDRIPFPAKIPGIFNVYGHTPQKNVATVKDHFACIDTGCYFKRQPYGKLTALQFPEMIVYEQENIE